MTIKKKAFILVFILIGFTLSFFVATEKLFGSMEKVRADINTYQLLSIKVEKINTRFWKLKEYVMENGVYNSSIHKEILQEVMEIEKLFQHVDVSSKKRENMKRKFEYIIFFLEQYDNRAEAFRETKEKLKFTTTMMDSRYFSLLFYITGGSDLYMLNTLYMLVRAYIEYRTNKTEERFFALKNVIDVLCEKIEDNKNLYFGKEYATKLKDIIEEDYKLFKQLKRIELQLSYITYRFESILKEVNSETEKLIFNNVERLLGMRKKTMNEYLIFIVVLLSIIITSIVWFLRSILKPIKGLNEVVKSISNGNLGVRFEAESNDEISNFGMAFNDMLEKIQDTTERLRREKEKVEKADAFKAEFIRRISHELRTPLNGIMGFSELLLDSNLSEEQKRYMDIVFKEAGKLRDMIAKILDFSTLERDLEEKKEKFNLVTLILDVVEKNKKKAEEKGLALKFVKKVDVPELLWGNPLSVSKIFDALIDNAIKFTPSGEVEVGIAEKGMEEDMYVFYFYVRDTGIGMTKEQTERIFDNFYQADPLLTRRFSGVGIGLTIVKRLVEKAGGHIWVESVPGEYTIFRFTLKFRVPEKIGTGCGGQNRGKDSTGI